MSQPKAKQSKGAKRGSVTLMDVQRWGTIRHVLDKHVLLDPLNAALEQGRSRKVLDIILKHPSFVRFTSGNCVRGGRPIAAKNAGMEALRSVNLRLTDRKKAFVDLCIRELVQRDGSLVEIDDPLPEEEAYTDMMDPRFRQLDDPVSTIGVVTRLFVACCDVGYVEAVTLLINRLKDTDIMPHLRSEGFPYGTVMFLMPHGRVFTKDKLRILELLCKNGFPITNDSYYHELFKPARMAAFPRVYGGMLAILMKYSKEETVAYFERFTDWRLRNGERMMSPVIEAISLRNFALAEEMIKYKELAQHLSANGRMGWAYGELLRGIQILESEEKHGSLLYKKLIGIQLVHVITPSKKGKLKAAPARSGRRRRTPSMKKRK